ncbi:MAG: hypothetical protein ABSF29_00110 [Tepidisphaeraceae bacterium]|jgi:hypothetical protein
MMTLGPDAIPSEVDPQNGGAGFGLATRHVCPFCGTIVDTSEGQCPRCLLENTTQTRQSTRSRLGPWYVLQTRNPSAPGMKFATLLALVRRGQVTAKTVIRGPTTHQFWRFAGRVKGVSREFGYCWSCSTAMTTTAVNCPRCGKGQEPPANPDIFLEGEAPPKTLFVDVSPKSGAMGAGGLPEASAAPEMEGLEIRGAAAGSDGRAARQGIPSAAATMAVAAGLPPPESAPAELRSRPMQQTREKILSAKELAAAFSLQYNPNSETPPPPPPTKTKRRLMAIAASLLVVLGGAAVFLNPDVRQTTRGWLGMNVQALPPPTENTSTDNSDSQLEHYRPDWAMKPPVTPPDDAIPSSPPAPAPAQPDLSQQAPPTPPAPAAETPTAVVNVPAAPVATVNMSGSDLDSLAMRLRSSGLDAEARHDYASAQYFYEQIEKLPRDHWPADTDQLLKNAQKMNQSAAGDQR